MHSITSIYFYLSIKYKVKCFVSFFPAKIYPQWINELLVEEYLGSTADPIKNRDGYKELMADMIFLIPTLTLAKAHKGAECIYFVYVSL